ncbi:MAG: 4-phosphopantoate--beta-alanine ligase, partial [Nitrospinota bacterium]
KALINKAKSQNDIVVVSTFVNRLQFQQAAFDNYPRNFEHDLTFCDSLNVDYLFAPTDDEIYSDGFDSKIVVNKLINQLDGGTIRWHYNGVTTIVAKLFNIINPDNVYFGEKDPHQLAIIKRMTLDFDFPINIVPVSIERDDLGLAFSSRNQFLTQEGRNAAYLIYKSILIVEKMIKNGEKNRSFLRETLINKIELEPLAKVEFAQIVDPDTLKEDCYLDRSLIYVATLIDNVRLTDNKIVSHN